MVALAKHNIAPKLTKAEQAAIARQDYIAYEMAHLTISGDEQGAFAVVQSQSADHVYKVRFDEPRGCAPYASFCPCDGFHFRGHCTHCEIIDAYFARIYKAMTRPVLCTFDTYVESLEDIYDLCGDIVPTVSQNCPEVVTSTAHIVTAKKRRSAKNAALVEHLRLPVGMKTTKKRSGGFEIKRVS